MKTYIKENLLKNKTVGGGGGENNEIALEIHIKETEGVLYKCSYISC